MNNSQPSPRIAVYPGSFDPITLGHLNVMERASQLFDRLIVGVGVNIDKQTLFTPEQREQLIHTATAHLPNVDIRTFTGLAVGFVKQCGAARDGPRRPADHRHRRGVDHDDGQSPARTRCGNALYDRRRRAGPRLQFAHQADRVGGYR